MFRDGTRGGSQDRLLVCGECIGLSKFEWLFNPCYKEDGTTTSVVRPQCKIRKTHTLIHRYLLVHCLREQQAYSSLAAVHPQTLAEVIIL